MLTASLLAALTADKDVSTCARESGRASAAYVAGALELKAVTLRSGQQMTVATSTDGCLAVGQSARIMIFEKTPRGYRRVLKSLTLPDAWHVGAGGSATLPTHESMDVIFEATYVWNGTSYAFAPLQSHRFDVGLGERRPYEVALQLSRGAPTTIAGTVAYNFGDDYAFTARAGETLTIELVGQTGRPPSIAFGHDDDISSFAELDSSGRWTGKLTKSGTYYLRISGTDESNAEQRSRYTLRLTIR
jgi:hypothetical protein